LKRTLRTGPEESDNRRPSRSRRSQTGASPGQGHVRSQVSRRPRADCPACYIPAAVHRHAPRECSRRHRPPPHHEPGGVPVGQDPPASRRGARLWLWPSGSRRGVGADRGRGASHGAVGGVDRITNRGGVGSTTGGGGVGSTTGGAESDPHGRRESGRRGRQDQAGVAGMSRRWRREAIALEVPAEATCTVATWSGSAGTAPLLKCACTPRRPQCRRPWASRWSVS